MIDGVVIKKLVTHSDSRGFFREIFRFGEEFDNPQVGQLSHSSVNQGVFKAWHGHTKQGQWNYVVLGKIHVALYDHRSSSSTYGKLVEQTIGDDEDPIAYYFPPGVLHGYKCLRGPMQIIYVTSGIYDLDDEVRIAPDEIDYDWPCDPES